MASHCKFLFLFRVKNISAIFLVHFQFFVFGEGFFTENEIVLS